MANFKEKKCYLCEDYYIPTSPKQKYCINCKDKAIKLKQQQRDKKRTLLRQQEKKAFIRTCPFCGEVFSTYYPKKIYCGSEECNKKRKKQNSRKTEIIRSKKRKFLRKYNRIINKSNKLKDIKKELSKDNYTLVGAPKYKNTHTSILKVKCPEGHLWETTWYNYYHNNNRCMTCYLQNNYVSKPEQLVRDFIEAEFSDVKVIYNDRSTISPKELDFYFPEYNLAIEVCGLYWHGELSSGRLRSYHYNKMMACYDKGIRLITIFEDELLNKPSIVFSRIRQALYKSKQRIFARKCQLIEIDSKTANTFFKNNHIQGKSTALIRYGLFYKDELVAVASAGNLIRKHTNSGKKILELKRFCSLLDVSIVGGAGKLFKAIRIYAEDNDYELIKSYCDMRYANIFKPVYEVLGFELEGFTKYTPHYIKAGQRWRNFTLRKTSSEKLTNKTEWELRREQGYDRIWDCGHRTYVYYLIN